MITKPVKYTEKVVIGYLEAFLNDLTIDTDIVYLGELLAKYGLYDELYSRWLEKYGTNRRINQAIKQIDTVLQARAVKGAMTGKYNPATTIFHLKNNYGWKDKTEVGISPLSDSPQLTDEQARKIAGRTLARKVLNTPSAVVKSIEPVSEEG